MAKQKPDFKSIRVKNQVVCEHFDFLMDCYDYEIRTDFLEFLVLHFRDMKYNLDIQKEKIKSLERKVNLLSN